MTDPQKPARAFLFSLREDGSPTCHPMSGLEKDGAPAFNTYRKSAKAQNLLRDPRAAVLMLQDWSVAPSTAQCSAGLMEETEPFDIAALAAAAADAAQGQISPGVVSRVRDRVAEGKRMYFRLKEH